MRAARRIASMAFLMLPAMSALGAQTAIHGFDGNPVPAERIDREAKRMMAEAKV